MRSPAPALPTERPPRRRACAVCAAVLFAPALPRPGAAQAPAQGAERIDVQAERRGDLIDVRASALVHAPMAVVWGTLTDYERMPGFIPGMTTSRVVARRGDRVTVAQTGEARFLFLSVPIDVTVETTERPPSIIEVRRVAGTLKHLQGRYDADPTADGRRVHLRWTGALSPQADLPPLIGTALVRLSMQDQFEGMVREIERRAGYRPPAADPVQTNR